MDIRQIVDLKKYPDRIVETDSYRMYSLCHSLDTDYITESEDEEDSEDELVYKNLIGKYCYLEDSGTTDPLLFSELSEKIGAPVFQFLDNTNEVLVYVDWVLEYLERVLSPYNLKIRLHHRDMYDYARVPRIDGTGSKGIEVGDKVYFCRGMLTSKRGKDIEYYGSGNTYWMPGTVIAATATKFDIESPQAMGPGVTIPIVHSIYQELVVLDTIFAVQTI